MPTPLGDIHQNLTQLKQAPTKPNSKHNQKQAATQWVEEGEGGDNKVLIGEVL